MSTSPPPPSSSVNAAGSSVHPPAKPSDVLTSFAQLQNFSIVDRLRRVVGDVESGNVSAASIAANGLTAHPSTAPNHTVTRPLACSLPTKDDLHPAVRAQLEQCPALRLYPLRKYRHVLRLGRGAYGETWLVEALRVPANVVQQQQQRQTQQVEVARRNSARNQLGGAAGGDSGALGSSSGRSVRRPGGVEPVVSRRGSLALQHLLEMSSSGTSASGSMVASSRSTTRSTTPRLSNRTSGNVANPTSGGQVEQQQQQQPTRSPVRHVQFPPFPSGGGDDNGTVDSEDPHHRRRISLEKNKDSGSGASLLLLPGPGEETVGSILSSAAGGPLHGHHRRCNTSKQQQQQQQQHQRSSRAHSLPSNGIGQGSSSTAMLWAAAPRSSSANTSNNNPNALSLFSARARIISESGFVSARAPKHQQQQQSLSQRGAARSADGHAFLPDSCGRHSTSVSLDGDGSALLPYPLAKRDSGSSDKFVRSTSVLAGRPIARRKHQTPPPKSPASATTRPLSTSVSPGNYTPVGGSLTGSLNGSLTSLSVPANNLRLSSNNPASSTSPAASYTPVVGAVSGLASTAPIRLRNGYEIPACDAFVCKIINSESSSFTQVANEVNILSNIAHPCIVAFQEGYVEPGRMNIVMEYVDGGDLRKEIDERRAPTNPASQGAGALAHHHQQQLARRYAPEQAVLALAVQLCLAMEYLHRHNILHRDLKPENIIVSKKWVVKLADFGLAKVCDRDVGIGTGPSSFVGTPGYAAPEVWLRRGFTEKTDMFGVGCIIYELVMLEKPFMAHAPARHGAGNNNNHHEPPPALLRGEFRAVDRPEISNDLRIIIESLLSPDPEERPSALEVLKRPCMIRAAKDLVRNYERGVGSRVGTVDKVWADCLRDQVAEVEATDCKTSAEWRRRYVDNVRLARNIVVREQTMFASSSVVDSLASGIGSSPKVTSKIAKKKPFNPGEIF